MEKYKPNSQIIKHVLVQENNKTDNILTNHNELQADLDTNTEKIQTETENECNEAAYMDETANELTS